MGANRVGQLIFGVNWVSESMECNFPSTGIRCERRRSAGCCHFDRVPFIPVSVFLTMTEGNTPVAAFLMANNLHSWGVLNEELYRGCCVVYKYLVRQLKSCYFPRTRDPPCVSVSASMFVGVYLYIAAADRDSDGIFYVCIVKDSTAIEYELLPSRLYRVP